jgi:DNA-binding XRE family transcriptional regulator
MGEPLGEISRRFAMRITDLKLERIKSGLKQVEVAKLAEIDRQRLCMIENGWVNPKADELKKIEAVIKVYAKTE